MYTNPPSALGMPVAVQLVNVTLDVLLCNHNATDPPLPLGAVHPVKERYERVSDPEEFTAA